jgi:hypothetical protein
MYHPTTGKKFMHYIRLVLISFIVLVIVVTGISLFIPSHVKISRATDINASKEKVMSLVSDPANWPQWYPVKDSLSLLVIDGKPKGIGNDAKGGLMITGITDSSVLAKSIGPGSRQAETGWNVLPGANPNNVAVQWYMDFHLGWYPWEKFAGLLLDKSYGPMLEQGLTNLKKTAESQ